MTKRAEEQLAADYKAALDAWIETGSAKAADDLAEFENVVCDFLEIPLDETEQGLTPAATQTIDTWLHSFSGS